MHLLFVKLWNFKNYEEAQLSFSPQINCFVGENGSGKTNLLDAIYYLALTKSAFQKTEQHNILHESSFFIVQGKFEYATAETFEIKCSYGLAEKKNLWCNEVPYERLSEHIGRFPAVLIAPNDTLMIQEGSEERRKFFDGIIAQTNPQYLQHLLTYNHYLLQRNSLLKQFAEKGYLDRDLLALYTEPLVEFGQHIHAERKMFIALFEPLFQKHYEQLTESREKVSLTYESSWQADAPAAIFSENENKDLILQRTSKGVHKDDYLFSIEDFSLKRYGSQGQQKSYIIALKLAQFDAITQTTGRKPLLLLDDIFDKLDDRRIVKLLEMMADGVFGQIFITDARSERSRQLLANFSADVRFFEIEKGNVN
jgi:DNA replication and repair protein RecF